MSRTEASWQSGKIRSVYILIISTYFLGLFYFAFETLLEKFSFHFWNDPLEKSVGNWHFTAAKELLLFCSHECRNRSICFRLFSTFTISNYLTNCRGLTNTILKPVCHLRYTALY